MPVIEEAKKNIAQQPQASLLTLTDLTNMGFTSEIVEAMKVYTLHNKPFVKAAAVVGAVGLLTVAKGSIEKNSMRGLTTFTSREEAQEWLVNQP